MSVTNRPIELSFFVDDVGNKLPLYDRLRWYRGVTGSDGVFEQATAEAAASATLVSTSGRFSGLNGKALKLRVNGVADVSIQFSSANPVSSAQAASEINTSSVLLSATNDSEDRIVISTVDTGSSSSLVVLEGTDAFELGLAIGQFGIGLDTDALLTAGVHEYLYTDKNSSPDYWYRTQYRHSSGAQNSNLSVAIPSNQADHVPLANTITCFIRITDMVGRPIQGRKITIHNTFKPSSVSADNKVWGAFRHMAELATDRNGYAETRLIRGIEVDVVIDGTGYIRRITIPMDGDSVDLLDQSLSTRDEFGIQTPNVDYAIRTS